MPAPQLDVEVLKKEVKQASMEDQLGDLKVKVRNLTLRVERLEKHVHDQTGKPVIELTQLFAP